MPATRRLGAKVLPYDKVVAADTPQSWWKLGDTSGPATDSAGARPMAVAGTGITYGVPGIPGSVHTACSFNGNGGFNDNGAGFSIASPWSMEHWVATTTDPATNFRQAVFAFGGFPNVLAAVNGHADSIEADMGTINSVYLTGFPASGNLRDGAWHHIVQTYDGTTQRLYIDGSMQASQAKTYTPFLATCSIANQSISGQNWTYLVGSAAHAAWYSYALSAAQVLAHYNAGLNK